MPVQGSAGVAVGPLHVGAAGAVTSQVALSEDSELLKRNRDRWASKDVQQWCRVSVGGAVAVGVGRGPAPLSPPDETPPAGTPPAEAVPGASTPPPPPAPRGLELAPGATVGFSAAFQMVAIVPAKSLGAVPSSQLDALRFDVGADAVAKLPAGSEIALAGQPMSVEVGASFGGSVDAGPLTAQVGASATVREAGDAYLKHLVVERDGKVTVTVRRFDERAFAVAAGAQAGLGGDDGLLGGAAQRLALDEASDGHRTHSQIVDSGEGGMARAALTAGARQVEEDGVTLRRTFDLERPAERAAYEALMRLPPSELGRSAGDVRRRLEAQGAGTATHESSRALGWSVHASAGPFFGIQLEDERRSRRGTRFDLEGREPAGSAPGDRAAEAPRVTRLASEERVRTVAGALPRLVLGEERAVRVGVHEASVDGGPVDRRVTLALEVASPRLSDGEARALERLAEGASVAATPDAAGRRSAGKQSGRLRLELEVPSDGLSRLQALDGAGLEAALAAARERVGLAPPPWRLTQASKRNPSYANEGHQDFSPPSVAARFAAARGEWSRADSSAEGDAARRDLRRDYAATTGRDLESDLRQGELVRELGERLAATRAQPVEAWRPVVALLGSLHGADLGTAIALFREEAGATVQGLELELGGKMLVRRGDASREPMLR